jgi:hypothetical protein
VQAHAQDSSATDVTNRNIRNGNIPNANVGDKNGIVAGRRDTTRIMKAADTAVKKRLPFQPIPKKAGLYSALFPGSGQIYNRQYWKVPILYAGFGVAGYFIATNYSNYNKYRTAYIAVIDSDPNTISTELYGQADLKQLQDQYKQWVDLTVLFTSLGYMLQVMDAVVFAHLKNFDISPDISLKMRPMAMPNGGLGFGLAFNF